MILFFYFKYFEQKVILYIFSVSSPRTATSATNGVSTNSCQQQTQGVRKGEAPGLRVRRYALQLAMDKSTTFSQNVDHFIACTKDGRERQPHVVMRNMRQFMSGMLI